MVTFDEQDHQIVCTFTGQLNTSALMADAPGVEQRVAQAGGHSVAFDLRGVTFIASSFLRLCVQTAKAVGASRFSIRNLSPEVKKVFVISGLDKQMRIS